MSAGNAAAKGISGETVGPKSTKTEDPSDSPKDRPATSKKRNEKKTMQKRAKYK